MDSKFLPEPVQQENEPAQEFMSQFFNLEPLELPGSVFIRSRSNCVRQSSELPALSYVAPIIQKAHSIVVSISFINDNAQRTIHYDIFHAIFNSNSGPPLQPYLNPFQSSPGCTLTGHTVTTSKVRCLLFWISLLRMLDSNACTSAFYPL